MSRVLLQSTGSTVLAYRGRRSYGYLRLGFWLIAPPRTQFNARYTAPWYGTALNFSDTRHYRRAINSNFSIVEV